MSWRDTQLKWYGGTTIQQDVELAKFVIENDIHAVKYMGDSDYLKEIIEREQHPATMIILLINHKFRFSEIVAMCNSELKKLGPGGFLYLAINKFLAVPEPQNFTVDDYDQAIHEYVKHNINFSMLQYHSGQDDSGKKFNWVHPITRFYFYHENFI
jgi:hypothetical protein